MMMLSLRLDRKKITAGALALLLVLGGAAGVREALWQGLDQTTAARRRVNTAAANEGQRRDLIAAYGWEVAEEPLEEVEL